MFDSYSRTNKPAKQLQFNPMGRVNNLSGVFIGFVKDNTDVQRMGRLKIWIPEFGSLPNDIESWITVSYCSPFAGATNPMTEDKNNVQSFEGTQTSYGMWMVPPDLENQVIVMFIGGDASKGIWIGCLYQEYMNEMVPGMASSTNNYQYGTTSTTSGHTVPVAEYNKWTRGVTDPDSTTKPFEKTKFKGVGNQGLLQDPIRGTTTTSARREAPSQTYGILTPGPLQPGSTDRRMGGSSFIMDDGTGSEYVQFATKTGAQIKIDETNGFIFLINRDGTAWIQMDAEGNIDIFGATDISMRAQKDINLRADRNINIEAGQNIFIKAAADTTQTTTQFTYDVNGANVTKTIPFWEYQGEGQGEGGDVVIQALNNLQTTIQNNAYITILQDNLNIDINNNLSITTQNGGQDFNSNKGIKLTTNAALDIATTGAIRVGSNSNIDISAQSNINLCTSSAIGINSATDILVESGSSFQVGTPLIILQGSNMVGINGGGGIISAQSNTVGINGGGGTVIASGGNVDLNGSGVVPTPAAPATPPTPQAPWPAAMSPVAEVKPLNNKINVLPDWTTSLSYPAWQPNIAYNQGTIVTYQLQTYQALVNIPNNVSTFNSQQWQIYIPIDKFVRNSEAFLTTVSRLPTFEPCPENIGTKLSTIAGNIAPQTSVYVGSANNPDATTPPPDDTQPGASNTSVQSDGPTATTVITNSGSNFTTVVQQLIIYHEASIPHSYLDTKNNPTGGIGHLMTPSEIALYPAYTQQYWNANSGTPIPLTVRNAWFASNLASVVAGAISQLGNACWDALNDNRKAAYCDILYNIGSGSVSKVQKRFPGLIAALQAGDYTTAGSLIGNNQWWKGYVKNRAVEDGQIMTTGVMLPVVLKIQIV